MEDPHFLFHGTAALPCMALRVYNVIVSQLFSYILVMTLYIC